ncbi:hypothetical protein [Brevibacterium luteolum]|uniref:Uncharacterized protein n=1 Tax=Brevibacterium luteolum TaxID=199591 RepID=A0A849APQ4_9MICO|nr:hypothetical protein [Brevibacterium luteolum]MBM7530439.1 hypothetical protein [Brevibacterium luteolum]NNG77835.1 hypothetical protein [Brevibacterium luteolum]
MTYVKGPNGTVFDVAEHVASGLINGGHVKPATKDEFLNANPGAEPAKDGHPTDASKAVPPLGQVAGDLPSDTIDIWPPDKRRTAADLDAEREADTETDTGETDTGDTETPAGNASKDTWREHALTLGFAEEQLDGLGRDDIKKLVSGDD